MSLVRQRNFCFSQGCREQSGKPSPTYATIIRQRREENTGNGVFPTSRHVSRQQETSLLRYNRKTKSRLFGLPSVSAPHLEGLHLSPLRRVRGAVTVETHRQVARAHELVQETQCIVEAGECWRPVSVGVRGEADQGLPQIGGDGCVKQRCKRHTTTRGHAATTAGVRRVKRWFHRPHCSLSVHS